MSEKTEVELEEWDADCEDGVRADSTPAHRARHALDLALIRLEELERRGKRQGIFAHPAIHFESGTVKKVIRQAIAALDAAPSSPAVSHAETGAGLDRCNICGGAIPDGNDCQCALAAANAQLATAERDRAEAEAEATKLRSSWKLEIAAHRHTLDRLTVSINEAEKRAQEAEAACAAMRNSKSNYEHIADIHKLAHTTERKRAEAAESDLRQLRERNEALTELLAEVRDWVKYTAKRSGKDIWSDVDATLAATPTKETP